MQRIGQSVGKDYAYLLGVYLGDGCVTTMSAKGGRYRYTVFRLNSIDPEFVEAAGAALAALGCERIWRSSHPVSKSSKPNHSLTAKTDICDDLVFDTHAKAKLPDMDGWSRDEKLAFVAGLMDSEGFVGENKGNPTNRRYYMGFKCCERWVPEFKRLLDSLGIRSGKIGIEAPRKEGYRTPKRFTIKMQSWINSGARFNIARKQKRVDEWASFGAYERRARRPRRSTSETTRQTPAEPVMI